MPSFTDEEKSRSNLHPSRRSRTNSTSPNRRSGSNSPQAERQPRCFPDQQVNLPSLLFPEEMRVSNLEKYAKKYAPSSCAESFEDSIEEREEACLSPDTFRREWRSMNSRQLLSYCHMWKKAGSDAGSSACEDDFEDILNGKKTSEKTRQVLSYTQHRYMSSGEEIFQDSALPEGQVKSPPQLPTRPYHRRKFTFVRYSKFLISLAKVGYFSDKRTNIFYFHTNVCATVNNNRAALLSLIFSSIFLHAHAHAYTP